MTAIFFFFVEFGMTLSFALASHLGDSAVSPLFLFAFNSSIVTVSCLVEFVFAPSSMTFVDSWIAKVHFLSMIVAPTSDVSASSDNIFCIDTRMSFSQR